MSQQRLLTLLLLVKGHIAHVGFNPFESFFWKNTLFVRINNAYPIFDWNAPYIYIYYTQLVATN